MHMCRASNPQLTLRPWPARPRPGRARLIPAALTPATLLDSGLLASAAAAAVTAASRSWLHACCRRRLCALALLRGLHLYFPAPLARLLPSRVLLRAPAALPLCRIAPEARRHLRRCGRLRLFKARGRQWRRRPAPPLRLRRRRRLRCCVNRPRKTRRWWPRRGAMLRRCAGRLRLLCWRCLCGQGHRSRHKLPGPWGSR